MAKRTINFKKMKFSKNRNKGLYKSMTNVEFAKPSTDESISKFESSTQTQNQGYIKMREKQMERVNTTMTQDHDLKDITPITAIFIGQGKINLTKSV